MRAWLKDQWLRFSNPRKWKCSHGRHRWVNHRRSRQVPGAGEAGFVATLAATCEFCGAELRESRWAFMKGSGALEYLFDERAEFDPSLEPPDPGETTDMILGQFVYGEPAKPRVTPAEEQRPLPEAKVLN